MAMTMSGEVSLPADRATVWAKLNDADTLKACIPGCEELVQDDPTHFSAVAKVKIGPVKATFRGKVELTDLDPPNGYRINGEGEGALRVMRAAGQRSPSQIRPKAAPCSPMRLRHRSAARSCSSAHASSTASPRSMLTSSSPISKAR